MPSRVGDRPVWSVGFSGPLPIGLDQEKGGIVPSGKMLFPKESLSPYVRNAPGKPNLVKGRDRFNRDSGAVANSESNREWRPAADAVRPRLKRPKLTGHGAPMNLERVCSSNRPTHDAPIHRRHTVGARRKKYIKGATAFQLRPCLVNTYGVQGSVAPSGRC